MAGETVLFLGFGYSAQVMARQFANAGAQIIGTARTEKTRDDAQMIAFDGRISAALKTALSTATILISSIPPRGGRDPFLSVLPAPITALAPHCRYAAYLSATSVYGDRGGQWTFEDELLFPTTQRGKDRIAAELAWLESGVPIHVFRLAGIYGPGRNAFAKIQSGAPAVIKDGHTVNRIYVDDIAGAVRASIARPDPGQVYNIADGRPAPPQDVLDYAAEILGRPRPARVSLQAAQMSDMARSFYRETKRISIARAQRALGWTPQFPDYKAGLAACYQSERET